MSDPAAPEGARVERLPPAGMRWMRVRHEPSKGGCGADITEHCAAFTIQIPMPGQRGPGGTQPLLQQVVRITPMLCPGCGAPLYFEKEPSKVELASAIPALSRVVT